MLFRSVEIGGGIILPDAIQKIGINSLGSWSHETIQGIPYAPRLNMMLHFKNRKPELKEMYKANILPVFEDDFEEYSLQKAAELTEKYKDDSMVIGYFMDNELPFYKEQLSLSLDLEHTNKQWLEANKWMTERYGSDYSIDSISTEDEKEYQGYVCEKYYEVVSKAIRAHDKNHLLLGTRFHGAAKSHKQIMLAAGKYTDVISVNYYGKWEPDTENLALWLQQANKPFIITEFYVKGADTKLGNLNGAGWEVQTQADRAIFFENFVIKLMKSPGFVGYNWFRYIDNNQTNKGIISASYEWYPEMQAAFLNINRDIYRLRSHLLYGNVNYDGWVPGPAVPTVPIFPGRNPPKRP